MVLPIIYAYLCLHVPTVDQTEVAYVAIMRVRIGVAIQARTITRDSKGTLPYVRCMPN